ncbi:gp53-like domain-containing protein [Micromonospora globispora]|uniref:gp53-like domain-containing protein n=1 Tax=Micromonospora globispora TaxID=1450148 RepID=UPI000F5D5B0B|nr:hypothetical protein [Micromonospora globispora]RQW83551.1 hypothetical protein DKL51_31490 [Micromonospora globispora]
MVAASGQRIDPATFRAQQAGQLAWSTSATTTSGILTVTFPAAFAAAPSFVTQVVSGSGSAIRATVLVLTVSTTQATLRVDLNASATTSGTVHWIATDMS